MPFRLIKDKTPAEFTERFSFLLSCFLILVHWFWAINTQSQWIFADDIIRIRLADYLADGVWPHKFGETWLPGTTLYHAPFALVTPGGARLGCSIANLLATLFALYSIRRIALLIASPVTAILPVFAFASSYYVLRVSTSALSEPLTLALLTGGAWQLAEAWVRGCKRHVIVGITGLVLAEATRFEAWPATILPAAVVFAVSFRRQSRCPRWARAALLALLLIPFLWLFAAWISTGHPLTDFNKLAQRHYAYHHQLTVWERLARLAPAYLSIAAGVHYLSLTGLLLVRPKGRTAAGAPAAVIGIIIYAMLLWSAVRGVYTNENLERFLLPPFALLLPFAAVPLERLRLSAPRWVIALQILLMGGCCLSWLEAPKDYERSRASLRLNLIGALKSAAEDRPWTVEKQILHVIPEKQTDVLINTLVVLAPERGVVLSGYAINSPLEPIIEEANTVGAGTILLDSRLGRATWGYHSWWHDIRHGKPSPHPRWEPVIFVDDYAVFHLVEP